MNLKGSHLLYLVIILFANYLAYTNNFPWWSYTIEYIIILIRGVQFVTINRENLDFRMYNNPEEAKADRDDYLRYKSNDKPWYKSAYGHKSFNEIKALQYSGDIFYILTMLPAIPFILFDKFVKFLDNNLTLKA